MHWNAPCFFVYSHHREARIYIFFGSNDLEILRWVFWMMGSPGLQTGSCQRKISCLQNHFPVPVHILTGRANMYIVFQMLLGFTWRSNMKTAYLNYSTFGTRGTLDRPRSVYKSGVERCLLEFWVDMARWPWRSWSMTRIFNTGWENPKIHIWCKFGDSSSTVLQLITREKPNFLNDQNDLEGLGQWLMFSIPTENFPRCIFGANFIIPALISHELSHGQVEFPRIMIKNDQNDLESRGQWPPFSISTELTSCLHV